MVAAVVDINNLQKSIAFGRLLSEQLSSRLAQLGVQVNEVKLSENLFVSRNEGEFLLTRERHGIGTTYNADTVLVGTYADGCVTPCLQTWSELAYHRPAAGQSTEPVC